MQTRPLQTCRRRGVRIAPWSESKARPCEALHESLHSLFFYSFLLPNQQRTLVDLVVDFDRDLTTGKNFIHRLHINLHGRYFLLPLAVFVFDLYMVPYG